jgi:uncharacterized protein
MLTSATAAVQCKMSKLVQPVTISLPSLPQALQGVRLAHLSDLHICRPRRRYQTIADRLAAEQLDLLLLTGDYIIHPGDEVDACRVLSELLSQIRPRFGAWGVFGNHDTPALCRMARDLPVRWLCNEATQVADLPLRIVGLHSDTVRRPDAIAALALGSAAGGPAARDVNTMTLMLCHYPTMLPTAADLGVDFMVAGHTHGGQCRLPTGHALVNSCDLPLGLTSGILRHRNTLCAVSRGLGEVGLPLRLFCRPHLPIYTLCRGPLPGNRCDGIHNVQPW